MHVNHLTDINGKLDLYKVLELLVLEGIVSRENLQILRSIDKNQQFSKQHPFLTITQREWKNQSKPEQLITIDELVRWLSVQTAIPVKRIDPLGIDVRSITAVMSFSYDTTSMTNDGVGGAPQS